MPRGDKSAYTDKQKRQAAHIEEGYEESGVPEEEAERRAWATVNAMTGGGKKSGSGRGKPVNKAPARKGGRKGRHLARVAQVPARPLDQLVVVEDEVAGRLRPASCCGRRRSSARGSA